MELVGVVDEFIVINRNPKLVFIILNFDSIRISFIPALQNFTFGKAASDIRIDEISDIK